LPHSEILGSKPVCGSPKLIAAYHVLHRLLAPRHSPYALSSLTIKNSELTLRAEAPRDSPLHTACVYLWSEKTTVCRIFSCQRSNVLSYCAASYRYRNFSFYDPRATGRKQDRRKPGGEYRARTGDLLVANQALSQLS
jgi:hypothetical protein